MTFRFAALIASGLAISPSAAAFGGPDDAHFLCRYLSVGCPPPDPAPATRAKVGSHKTRKRTPVR